jgi:hypothetical protein
VVLPETPLAVQQVAAEELARYVPRLLGRTEALPIVPVSRYAPEEGSLAFFVGAETAKALWQEELAPWQEEEWLLRTVPGGLLLAGQDTAGNPWSTSTPAGTLLATYTLLDDYLGVRWFWPGAFGEHVPLQPDAIVPPLARREVPRFMIRSVSLGYTSYHTATFREESRRWARRNRQGWTRSAVFGHSWYDAFDLKRDVVFNEHPEWFALVNGERRKPQMCTTHPEVIARMVEYVLNGKQDIMNISPSDGGGFCTCTEETKSDTHKRLGIPSCTSLDVPGLLAYDGKTVQLSDRIFTYANEVARRVRERNPRKGCGMFAYTFYNRPPARLDHLEPNLYLSFVFQSAAHRDPAALAEWRASVSGWQRLGARMVVREGWGNHYYHDLPWVHADQISANLSEASRLGFIAAYGEGSKCFATQAPNYYALTRMMWQPDRDPGQVMADFWPAAYGPAAAPMAAYFGTYQRALDERWAQRRKVMDTPGIAYVNLINSWHLLLPPAVLDEAERHLAAAAAAAPPGEYADRVAFHQVGQRYTRVVLELFDCYRQLAELGVELEGFSAGVTTPRVDAAARQALLQRALALAEQREDMLLAHRDWAAMDEGLYAYTNDARLRQWYAAVQRAAGVERPPRLTKALLTAP